MTAKAPRTVTLDAASLERLRELDPDGRTGLLRRIFQAFDSSAQRLAEKLVVARQEGDLPAIRHVAHTLKSSSASIGALHLSQLCASAEATARDGRTVGLDAQLDALGDELADVLHTVRRPPDSPA